MSQDSHDRWSYHDLPDASRLFLADLQAVALAAWQLIGKVGAPGTATQNMDAAWLQGFGYNLANVQTWIIEHGSPFTDSGVEEIQLLFRLDMLHSQVEEVVTASDRLVLSKYLESSANIIQLFKAQPGIEPGIVNIGFLLGTLRDALECSPQNVDGTGRKPSQAVSPQARKKIDIFVAAGEGGMDFAEQLAATLGKQKVGLLNIRVVRSWTKVLDLSKHALPGMVSAINSCQYGALVLQSDEVTVDAEVTDSGNSSTRRFRLSADLEFLLGLMVGILNFQNTFLVVPKTEETQLSRLLIGLELASYDPSDTDGGAMHDAAYLIKNTISRLEKIQ